MEFSQVVKMNSVVVVVFLIVTYYHKQCISVAAGARRLFRCFCRCIACTLRAKPEPRMPAGKAKNDMPISALKHARILPPHVTG